MTSVHPLDRPVWSALTTGWAHLAQGTALALRVDLDFGLFAAPADDSADAWAALAGLIPVEGEVWVVDDHEVAPPPGTQVLRTGAMTQMVAHKLHPRHCAEDHVRLTDDDAPAMRALVELTKPGPFEKRTHQLGGFIGIKENGRLIAMAGERMRMTGFAEVSGVCTHPDAQGRGLAGALMSAVMTTIIGRGETPFLHTYASNTGAIALYEKLGFETRKPMMLTVLTRDRGV